MPTIELPDAQAVRQSTTMQVAGRAGMVTRGILHLLIALLAVEVVRGRPTEEAGAQGAIATVARQPFGRVLVALIAVGLLGYAMWRGAQAVVGRDDDDSLGKRAGAALRSLLYLVLAGAAGKAVLRGNGDKAESSSGGEGKQQATATVLGWPGGRFLVAGAGLAVLAVAFHNGYRGFTRNFEDDLDTGGLSSTARRAITVIGVVGHAGRLLAYALVGGLLVLAAVRHDPSNGDGLDKALHELAGARYGIVVLFVLAAGLAAFGVYQLIEARYRDVAD